MASKSWLTDEEKHKPVTFSAAPEVRAKIESMPRNTRSAWINYALTQAIKLQETWQAPKGPEWESEQ